MIRFAVFLFRPRTIANEHGGGGAWQRLVPFRRSNLTHLSRPSSSMHCQAQANGLFPLSRRLEEPFYPLLPPLPPPPPAASLSFRFVSSRLARHRVLLSSYRLSFSFVYPWTFRFCTPSAAFLSSTSLQHLVPLLMSGYFLPVTLSTAASYFSFLSLMPPVSCHPRVSSDRV